MYLSWSVGALAVAGYGVAGATWQAAGFALVYGATMAVASVTWATLLQTRVPDGLRGRVASVDFIVSLGLTPVSLALVAPVASVVGVQATMIGAGLGGAGVLTVALAVVGRRPRRRDAPRVPEAATVTR
jgi:DHA3 family tetracycline resistance protein-like MFS transporter